VLARSAQAVVLERTVRQPQHFPLQTITGCSRQSGKRRTIDTLQRRSAGDPTKLIGLRLTGTRIAYAMVFAAPADQRTTIMADDAVHGGRRHDLGGHWPFGSEYHPRVDVLSWAVDAEGDVAWILAQPDTGWFPAPQSVGVWRPGLGLRQVDAQATFGGLTLRDGVLGWRRNGAPHSVDLAHLPRSACGALKATVGTLDVDLVQPRGDTKVTACLRVGGRTVTEDTHMYAGDPADVIDVNGPYLLFGWALHVHTGAFLVDLLNGSITDLDGGLGDFGSVVDDRGSVAWLADGLWIHDAGGTRKVADAHAGTGPLLRDGATVTWSGGGPTVTLDP
jgi:hypothetical protein